MEQEKHTKEGESIDRPRRRFLKGCGITALTTVSYHIISILSGNMGARASECTHGCVDACITSCTGCTTVNCTSGNTLPEPVPKCVKGFKGSSE